MTSHWLMVADQPAAAVPCVPAFGQQRQQRCYIQSGHSPGKPGKVREFKSGQGKCVLACTKFGQLDLRKIIEIVATRCQILRLKCTKFDFG